MNYPARFPARDRAILAGATGTYALVMYMPCAQEIYVGALGRSLFPNGWYIYVGSAMNGLSARILRHLRRDKKLFWHIDYVLEHAYVHEVWIDKSGRRLECEWARAACSAPNASVVVPRFGASDCHCASHLIHLSSA